MVGETSSSRQSGVASWECERARGRAAGALRGQVRRCAPRLRGRARRGGVGRGARRARLGGGLARRRRRRHQLVRERPRLYLEQGDNRGAAGWRSGWCTATGTSWASRLSPAVGPNALCDCSKASSAGPNMSGLRLPQLPRRGQWTPSRHGGSFVRLQTSGAGWRGRTSRRWVSRERASSAWARAKTPVACGCSTRPQPRRSRATATTSLPSGTPAARCSRPASSPVTSSERASGASARRRTRAATGSVALRDLPDIVRGLDLARPVGGGGGGAAAGRERVHSGPSRRPRSADRSTRRVAPSPGRFAEARNCSHRWRGVARSTCARGPRPRQRRRSASRDLAERSLRQTPITFGAERSVALELLVTVEVALGDVEAGERALGELKSIAASRRRAATSRASRAGGQVAAAAESSKRRVSLEDAVDSWPLQRAVRERLGATRLARVLGESGRTAAAREEVATARVAFERLAAQHGVEQASGSSPTRGRNRCCSAAGRRSTTRELEGSAYSQPASRTRARARL